MEDFHVSNEEAKRIREVDMKRILAERKLLLVLDIDHTLLNSAKFSEISFEDLNYLRTVQSQVEDIAFLLAFLTTSECF